MRWLTFLSPSTGAAGFLSACFECFLGLESFGEGDAGLAMISSERGTKLHEWKTLPLPVPSVLPLEMKAVRAFLTRGLNAGLQEVAVSIFDTLVKSKTFRNTVVETEKTIIKGIRYAGNPQRETNAFHQREKDEIDHLAKQARQAATGPAKPKPSTPPPSSNPIPPPNMTSHGYQPESEWSRWYKTKKYEFGMLKTRWFK